MSAGIHSPTRWRRLRTSLRFVATMPMFALRYLLQRVPLYRRNRVADDQRPPDLDREWPGDPSTLQRAHDGVGPLFHRHYRITVTDEEHGPEALIGVILHDPNSTTPRELARFERPDGGPAGDLEVGDEVVVRLPGPWNGPVRLVERTPRSFRFATLEGHLEAGEIEFRAGYDERGLLEFEIESWARCGDRLFDILYERFPVGRELQLHMWSQFCQRVAKVAGGVRMSNVSATTRRLE